MANKTNQAPRAEAKQRRKIKRKPGVTDPSKMYFNADTQAAIVEYQRSDDRKVREDLYVKRIAPAFKALVDNLVNIHRFAAINETVDELKFDCVHFLFETIRKFDPERGTAAFSYFNVVAKNWLIIRTKNKNIKARKLVSIDDDECSSALNDKISEEAQQAFDRENQDKEEEGMLSMRMMDMLSELRSETVNPNELLAIDSICRMFEMAGHVDILNKAAVTLYLRELSGLSGKQLTAALHAVRKRYRERRDEIFDR